MPESGPQEFGNSSYLGCLLVSQLDRLARRALHAAARTPSELREVLTQLWEESEESQRSTALKVAARTAEAGLHMVPYDDERYPAVLREIDDPPYVLWVRCRAESQLAQLPALSMVAVVGSRRADAEGTAIARESGAYLASCGATVVSGLAFGIDAAAHRGALQTTLQCPTIAVLACGLDRVYPAAHRSLTAQILDSGGMLVSHFPPRYRAVPGAFPRPQPDHHRTERGNIDSAGDRAQRRTCQRALHHRAESRAVRRAREHQRAALRRIE